MGRAQSEICQSTQEAAKRVPLETSAQCAQCAEGFAFSPGCSEVRVGRAGGPGGERLKFFGTEEAQLLASSYGAAISAYNGTEQPYFDAFDKAGYDINVEIVMDQFEYGVQNVNNAAKPKWKSPVLDELNKVYNGQQSLDSALDNMQNIIDTETAKKLADN